MPSVFLCAPRLRPTQIASAMAGDRDEMNDKSKKSSNEAPVSGNPGHETPSPATVPQPRGRKPGPPAAGLGRRGGKPARQKPAAPRRRRKLPPGRGGERLRSSVNFILNDESDRIARALVEKTIAGNMTGARLLVELSGAKHPPAELEDNSEVLKLIDELAAEPQWDPSMDDQDPAKQLPGEPLISFQARTLSAPKPAT